MLLSYMYYYDETRTHLSLAKDSPQGVFFAAQSSADCITNMSGFDSRQAQVPIPDCGCLGDEQRASLPGSQEQSLWLIR